MKTFLITAAMAASAFAFGWQGNDITSEMKSELMATGKYVTKTVAMACIETIETPDDVDRCKSRVKLWAYFEDDKQEALREIARVVIPNAIRRALR